MSHCVLVPGISDVAGCEPLGRRELSRLPQQTFLTAFILSLKDLPTVALPSTTMSRREFRKLHFIAKEEEEEEDVV